MTTTPTLTDITDRVISKHRIASQHPDLDAVTCAHDSNGLATYSTSEHAQHFASELLQAVLTYQQGQREAFLPSPNLDPAWIAGWHAATDHHAGRIADTTKRYRVLNRASLSR